MPNILHLAQGCHSPDVTATEDGSVAYTLTESVTCRTEMLPSDRQMATMVGLAGFHFRSLTTAALPESLASL